MAINSMGYNTQRISGMFSGMDTQSLVKNMLATDQTKIDNIFRKQEKAEWKLEAYSELNTSVSTLRNKYMSVLGENSLIKHAAYNNYKVDMAENSAIRISGTSTAMPTNFQILAAKRATSARSVNQLDSSQTETTGSSLLKAQATGGAMGLDATMKLSDYAEQYGLAGDSLSFSINGETFTFTGDKTLGDVMSAVNASEKANATMELKDGAMSITSKALGADSKLEFKNIKGNFFSTEEGKGVGIAEGAAARKSILSDLGNTTFQEFAQASGLSLSGTSFTINGGENQFSLVDDAGNAKSIQAVMDEVNASNAGVNMSFNETTGQFTIRNKADGRADTAENRVIYAAGAIFGENSVTGIEQGTHNESGAIKRSDSIADVARKLGVDVGETLNFKINDVEFSFDTRTTSLSDVMEKVNNDPDAGAVFSYSELTDAFEVRSAETGAGTALKIEGLEAFGLGAVEAGTDAEIKVNVNGTTRTIQQASNQFTLDGLEFDIIGTHEEGDGAINVNVERDYQPTIDAIKSFVEDYNKTIEALNTKYYERSYRAYSPLTEDERAAITEDEAAKWDEKAKSGVLRNDSTIGNLLTSLRTSLSQKVGDTGMSAFDIGLSTVEWKTESWRKDQGKLQLDEEALLAALKENPNAVQEVLAGVGEGGEISEETVDGVVTSNSGLLVRMNEHMRAFNSTMRAENIQNTTQDIADYAEKMTDMLVKMSEKEEKLWAQYSKMETLLSEMQSQQNWLASALGMGTASGS